MWWQRIGMTAGLLLALLARPVPSAAETTLRIVVPMDLAALPLLVAAHDRLIDKQAAARGVLVNVQWLVPNGGNPIDELVRGQADVVALIDVAEFVAAWDQRSGTPQEIRALAGLARMPYQLMSRNPAIATIRDFTAKDRIAVPVLKTSLPAVMLEMAAADEWGAAHYDKLDGLMVALGADDANTALRSGKGDVGSDFTRMPYADNERADPAIHRVMDSFDIAGAHSVALLLTTTKFHDANTALCAAIVDALTGADAFIKTNRGGAAEIYVNTAKDQGLQVEELTDMLGDPDTSFETAPAGLQRLAAFMHQIGRIKRNPESWQQMVFPDIARQPGS